MEDNFFMVSVVVITYNHESYIRQALDSILMQKVNFKYEVLVGDDSSSDKTQEILSEYEKKYPEVFKMFLRERNLGATRNNYELFIRAKGKYIASLEGDDYWSDENKLQFQVDFLEKNQQYIGTAHRCLVVNKDGGSSYLNETKNVRCHWNCKNEIYTWKEYNELDPLGQLSSYVYRNIYLESKYDYSILYKASNLVGDRTITMFLAAQGNIYCFDKIMSNYRFVAEPSKENWASQLEFNEDYTNDSFEYLIELEKYATNILNKSIDFTKHKDEAFLAFFASVVKRPTTKKIKELKYKLKVADKPLWYIYIGIKNEARKRFIFSPSDIIKDAIYKRLDETPNLKLSNGNWNELKKKLHKKNLILFGAGGDALWMFINKYGKKYVPEYLLDNDLSKANKKLCEVIPKHIRIKEEYQDLIIKHPSQLNYIDKENTVILIISLNYYEQIADQLEKMEIKDYFSFCIIESRTLISKLFKMANKYTLEKSKCK